MKTMTKIVKMPDGRTVKMTAKYEINPQHVVPEVEGPFDDLMSLIGWRFRGRIDGIGFAGWLQMLFDEYGCVVENTEEGEWREVYL